jgi:hypothetical protein
MLSLSDIDISQASSTILNAGYDVSFLVPTQTGLEKSILDAHESLRSFFNRTELHSYSLQEQGVIKHISAEFITSDEIFTIKVSLYRPKTKKGDPRIWIYGLTNLVKAGNLLALVVVEGQLYIFNCSNELDFSAALDSGLPRISKSLSFVATELLQKLVVISHRGFLPTVVNGDTGVGMTLEAELGISANSSKSPDYKGIELKASRVDNKNRQRNRSQLFSKIPNWKLSPASSAIELIKKRGYIDGEGDQALRQTVSGARTNAQGLFLDIDYANNYLRQMFENSEDFSKEHDTTWVLQDLKNALLKKHKETFWVKAQHNSDRASELFHYIEVEHTANPYIDKLETLIETGLITMDYTMHIRPNGKVRDHGYLFKLHQNSKRSLFPESTIYDLMSY